jgi:phosphoglycerate kinase
MQHIDKYDFAGKRALIRVDFNVPLDKNKHVTDPTRIEKALPTIQKVLKGGGAVVLMSHLGRPGGEVNEDFSLKHILSVLKNELGRDVVFAGDCVGDEAKSITSSLKPGSVVLLENLRFYSEETAGDEFFAGQLAEHGDCYINDAFGTAHRAHASTTIVANFFPNDKMFGLLMNDELESLDKVLNSEEKPRLAIIGGAKVSSKITVLKNILDRVDHMIIGGGMSYTFSKATGGQTGNSLVEDDYLETAKDLIKEAEAKGVKIHLPKDARIADDFRNDASTDVCPADEIPDDWMGLDIGPETIENFKELVKSCKVILWNGPMGVFEMENFSEGTVSIAKALVEATKKGAFTLVGGGDSVAAINKYHLAHEVSYVSTGGGAMLEYLEGKSLPGVQAIREG